MKLYCNKRSSVFLVNKVDFADSELIIFGFNGIKKVVYKNELAGINNCLSDFASLSKNSNKVFLTGAITDNYGITKKSVIIADGGKLLGISDMTLNVNMSNYSLGGGHRVYHTSIGRIGIIISDDIIDFDGIKAMTICDADIIVCVVDGGEKPIHNLLIRSYSYLFGVPMVLITEENVIASDINGEICGGSREDFSKIILPTKKCYRLITNKRRGTKE